MKLIKFNKGESDITVGKEYQIKFETNEYFFFFDEKNSLRGYFKYISYNPFEIIDRPVMVKVYDDYDLGGVEGELIYDIGDGFEFRYICKDKHSEIKGWKNIEYIKDKPKEEEKESSEIDSLKEDVNLLKGQVSDILRLLNEKI